jgi:hypothetical protein
LNTNTNSPGDIGTYIFTIKGELPNHQYLTLDVTIIVVASKIVPSVIPDISYFIGDPNLITVNSLFHSTDSSLNVIYTLWTYNVQGYDQSMIKFSEIGTAKF